MVKNDLPFLVMFGLAVASAVGALAYAFGSGTEPLIAIGTAVGCALIGQFMLMGLALRQDERRENALLRLKREAAGFQTEVRRRSDGFQMQIDALRQHSESHSSAVVQGLADLKHSYGGLRAMLEARVANPRVEAEPVASPAPQFMAPTDAEMPAEMPVPQVEPEAVAEAPPPVAAFAEEDVDAFADQVFFALEPVVDVLTRRTAHYRMHLGMALGGEELSNDRLLHYAGRMGQRPLLDMLAVREANALLGKLRQRDPDLSIFVNIGAETLADENALNALAGLRDEADPALASGLILEMPHAMLAGLSEQALEGLAHLARCGFGFALGNVSVGGLDLRAMNTLNVRHVGLAAGAIDPNDGPSTSLIGFAQMARLSRISVIVTGISNGQLVPRLGNVARLACGPCFASPRRVKRKLAAAEQMDIAA